MKGYAGFMGREPIATVSANKRWAGYAACHLQPNEEVLLKELYKFKKPREIGKLLSPNWPLSPVTVRVRMHKLGLKLRNRGGANNPKGLGGRNRRKE